MTYAVDDQPTPQRNDGVAIVDLVTVDLEARKQHGIEVYGTPLQANNGRDALVDLYQELLDAVIYTRQLLEEREINRSMEVQTKEV